MPIKVARIAALLLITALYAGAQTTVNPARLRIKGVGLESTYAQVVAALGKPRSETKATREECIGGREKSVKYAGLSFYMMDGDSRNGKTFSVKGFEASSAEWVVSGVKVGDTEAAVRKVLGGRF